MMPKNRWGKLKWLGCVKYKNGKPIINKKKLDEITGYIPSFSKKDPTKNGGVG